NVVMPTYRQRAFSVHVALLMMINTYSLLLLPPFLSTPLRHYYPHLLLPLPLHPIRLFINKLFCFVFLVLFFFLVYFLLFFFYLFFLSLCHFFYFPWLFVPFLIPC